jgi:hypothetical protein
MTRRSVLVFGAGFAAVLGGLALFLALTTPSEARQLLPSLTPRALEVAFLLLLVSAVASFSEIRDSLPERSFFCPLVVGLFALAVVTFVPPRTHRIYYDEDIYQNVAQSIVWSGRAHMCNEGTIEAGHFRCDASEYNKEPNALPFFLSLVFRLTGVSETAAHYLNHGFFALGAMAVFWLTALLFESATAGALAGLVYALTPQTLLWSATVAVEPGAAGSAAFALAAFFLFCREPSWPLAVFSASAFALASQFRPESVLILVVAAIFVLVTNVSLLRRLELWGTALLTLVLLVPHVIHTWAVRNEGWGSGDAGKFSWSVVSGNADTNFGYYVQGDDFPWLFTAFALAGLVHRGRRRESFSLLLWFALLFGIFIPFYAGSYRYGADVRFSLVSAAPLAALAGAGLHWMTGVFRLRWPGARALAVLPYALVLYAFTAYLPLTRAVGRESWASRADHEVALRAARELPEDAIVLTHNPGMFHVMGRSAAQSSLASYQPARVDDFFRRFSGGVYFHYNFWCNVPDPVQNEFCAKVLETYGTRVVFEESAGFYRYVLYRLLPRSDRLER